VGAAAFGVPYIAAALVSGGSPAFLTWASWGLLSGSYGFGVNLSHVVHLTTRTAIRKKYGIAGSCCDDYCTICWCESCAIAQEMAQMAQSNAVMPAAVMVGPTVQMMQPQMVRPCASPATDRHGQVARTFG
jgi:Cys-rich protein (TIGR01571 family)